VCPEFEKQVKKAPCRRWIPWVGQNGRVCSSSFFRDQSSMAWSDKYAIDTPVRAVWAPLSQHRRPADPLTQAEGAH